MLARIANVAWCAASLPAWRRFTRALRQPVETQGRLLRHLIDRHASSAYGRLHGFRALRSYEEFSRRVPIVDYDDLAPWITRIMRGETEVLTAEPVTHLVPTSGSTGARKLIPFTATLQAGFNAAIGPWIVDLLRAEPAVAGGPAYWSVSPLTSPAVPEESAVPIGFADDADYLGGTRARLVSAVLAVPSALRHVGEVADFRYLTLLCLLRAGNLRFVSVWHPSFLTLLLEALPGCWEELLRDLHRGSCRRLAAQPLAVAAAIDLRPCIALARRLRQADPTRPETVWPALRVVSCWAGGHAAGAVAALQHLLPHARIQPKGLLASEAFVTLPFGGAYPVAVCSHFFEFADEHGTVVPVEDLRPETTYEVVVTNGGGLWRYRLGDQVQLAGWVERTPALRFMGRGRRVSDLGGEKLCESFVASALAGLAAAGANPLKFAMLAPEADAAGWHYTLYCEGAAGPELATQLDGALRANPHYALCRDLGQLGPIRFVTLPANATEMFLEIEMARGLRLGDIKPAALSLHTDWTQRFAAVLGS